MSVRIAASNAFVPGTSNAQLVDLYQSNRVMYRVVDDNNKTYIYVGRSIITKDVTPPTLTVGTSIGAAWSNTGETELPPDASAGGFFQTQVVTYDSAGSANLPTASQSYTQTYAVHFQGTYWDNADGLAYGEFTDPASGSNLVYDKDAVIYHFVTKTPLAADPKPNSADPAYGVVAGGSAGMVPDVAAIRALAVGAETAGSACSVRTRVSRRTLGGYDTGHYTGSNTPNYLGLVHGAGLGSLTAASNVPAGSKYGIHDMYVTQFLADVTRPQDAASWLPIDESTHTLYSHVIAIDSTGNSDTRSAFVSRLVVRDYTNPVLKGHVVANVESATYDVVTAGTGASTLFYPMAYSSSNIQLTFKAPTDAGDAVRRALFASDATKVTRHKTKLYVYRSPADIPATGFAAVAGGPAAVTASSTDTDGVTTDVTCTRILSYAYPRTVSGSNVVDAGQTDVFLDDKEGQSLNDGKRYWYYAYAEDHRGQLSEVRACVQKTQLATPPFDGTANYVPNSVTPDSGTVTRDLALGGGSRAISVPTNVLAVKYRFKSKDLDGVTPWLKALANREFWVWRPYLMVVAVPVGVTTTDPATLTHTNIVANANGYLYQAGPALDYNYETENGRTRAYNDIISGAATQLQHQLQLNVQLSNPAAEYTCYHAFPGLLPRETYIFYASVYSQASQSKQFQLAASNTLKSERIYVPGMSAPAFTGFAATAPYAYYSGSIASTGTTAADTRRVHFSWSISDTLFDPANLVDGRYKESMRVYICPFAIAGKAFNAGEATDYAAYNAQSTDNAKKQWLRTCSRTKTFNIETGSAAISGRTHGISGTSSSGNAHAQGVFMDATDSGYALKEGTQYRFVAFVANAEVLNFLLPDNTPAKRFKNTAFSTVQLLAFDDANLTQLGELVWARNTSPVNAVEVWTVDEVPPEWGTFNVVPQGEGMGSASSGWNATASKDGENVADVFWSVTENESVAPRLHVAAWNLTLGRVAPSDLTSASIYSAITGAAGTNGVYMTATGAANTTNTFKFTGLIPYNRYTFVAYVSDDNAAIAGDPNETGNFAPSWVPGNHPGAGVRAMMATSILMNDKTVASDMSFTVTAGTLTGIDLEVKALITWTNGPTDASVSFDRVVSFEALDTTDNSVVSNAYTYTFTGTGQQQPGTHLFTGLTPYTQYSFRAVIHDHNGDTRYDNVVRSSGVSYKTKDMYVPNVFTLSANALTQGDTAGVATQANQTNLVFGFTFTAKDASSGRNSGIEKVYFKAYDDTNSSAVNKAAFYAALTSGALDSTAHVYTATVGTNWNSDTYTLTDTFTDTVTTMKTYQVFGACKDRQGNLLPEASVFSSSTRYMVERNPPVLSSAGASGVWDRGTWGLTATVPASCVVEAGSGLSGSGSYSGDIAAGVYYAVAATAPSNASTSLWSKASWNTSGTNTFTFGGLTAGGAFASNTPYNVYMWARDLHGNSSSSTVLTLYSFNSQTPTVNVTYSAAPTAVAAVKGVSNPTVMISTYTASFPASIGATITYELWSGGGVVVSAGQTVASIVRGDTSGSLTFTIPDTFYGGGSVFVRAMAVSAGVTSGPFNSLSTTIAAAGLQAIAPGKPSLSVTATPGGYVGGAAGSVSVSWSYTNPSAIAISSSTVRFTGPGYPGSSIDVTVDVSGTSGSTSFAIPASATVGGSYYATLSVNGATSMAGMTEVSGSAAPTPAPTPSPTAAPAAISGSISAALNSGAGTYAVRVTISNLSITVNTPSVVNVWAIYAGTLVWVMNLTYGSTIVADFSSASLAAFAGQTVTFGAFGGTELTAYINGPASVTLPSAGAAPTPTPAPAPTIDLTAVTPGTTSASIAFTFANASSGVYVLAVAGAAAANPGASTIVAAAKSMTSSSSPYTYTGLTVSTVYTFWAVARSSVGDAFDSISGTTTSPPPTIDLTGAVPNTNSATVTFTTSYSTSVYIQAVASGGANPGASAITAAGYIMTASPYLYYGLLPSTAYTLWAVATSSAGTTVFDSIAVTTSAVVVASEGRSIGELITTSIYPYIQFTYDISTTIPGENLSVMTFRGLTFTATQGVFVSFASKALTGLSMSGVTSPYTAFASRPFIGIPVMAVAVYAKVSGSGYSQCLQVKRLLFGNDYINVDNAAPYFSAYLLSPVSGGFNVTGTIVNPTGKNLKIKHRLLNANNQTETNNVTYTGSTITINDTRPLTLTASLFTIVYTEIYDADTNALLNTAPPDNVTVYPTGLPSTFNSVSLQSNVITVGTAQAAGCIKFNYNVTARNSSCTLIGSWGNLVYGMLGVNAVNISIPAGTSSGVLSYPGMTMYNLNGGIIQPYLEIWDSSTTPSTKTILTARDAQFVAITGQTYTSTSVL